MALVLKDLKNARGQIKAAVTRAQKYVESINLENADVCQLKNRRDVLSGKLRDFEDLQGKIETFGDSENQEIERENFETSFYQVLSAFDRVLNSLQEPIRLPSLQPTEANSASRAVRLPKIDLPHFSGEYDEWYPFHDTFNALIHSNNSLAPIKKFQYLKSSLKGDAAKVIQSLEMSEVNYAEAWRMLTVRYENKRLIVHTHLRAITDLPSMTKENSIGLRQLLDGVLKHTRALKSIGRPVDQWGDWLVHVISGKLDPITCKEWEDKLTHSDLPSFLQLTEFLSHRCQVLEALSHNSTSSTTTNARRCPPRQGTSSHVVTKSVTCQVCKEGHYIHQCDKFARMPIYQRIKVAREANLCLNCLRSTTHSAKTCNSSNCRKCHKKHNTMLHIVSDSSSNRSSNPDGEANAVAERETKAIVSNISRDSQASAISQVFLSTAIVDTYDKDGNLVPARVLLDSGSQSCFITEDFVKRLGMKTRRHNTPVVGINQATALAHHLTSIKFKSRFNNFNRTVDCIVLKNITQNLPLISLPRGSYQIPRNIKLADPNFYEGSRVDILLGAEVFFDTLCVGQIKACRSHPSIPTEISVRLDRVGIDT